jgi:NAD+ kinase
MKVYFFGKPIPAELANLLEPVFAKLLSLKIEILMNKAFYRSLSDQCESLQDIRVTELNLEINVVDCVVSVGGDGTLLELITQIKDKETPVLGVNAGRLGFLATTPISETDKIIEGILEKTRRFDKRNLIRLESDVDLFGDQNFALNEFAITKRDTSSMIVIKAYIDGEFLNSYWADGLIISTPTGSTGYSLSAGGPLVMPQTNNFVITPINPHSLTVRPVVVPDSCEIRLKIEGRAKKVLISLDHRSVSVKTDVDLVLKKEKFQVHLLKLDSYNYFNTLRNKLNWGLDIRN